MSDSLKCRFGNMELELEKNILRYTRKDSNGETRDYISLKQCFPFFEYDSWVPRLRRRLRLAAAGGLVVFAALTVLAISAEYSAGMMALVFLFFSAGVLLATIPWKKQQEKSHSLRILSDFTTGNAVRVPWPRRPSPEQLEFAGQLQAALNRYSEMEATLATFSSSWAPECFEILDRLRSRGVISEEEFIQLKRERIDHALRPNPPAFQVQ